MATTTTVGITNKEKKGEGEGEGEGGSCCQLFFPSSKEKVSNFAPLVVAHYLASLQPSPGQWITLHPRDLDAPFLLTKESRMTLRHTTAMLRYLARSYLPEWYEVQNGETLPEKSTTIDSFLHEVLHTHSMEQLEPQLAKMNTYLHQRSFMVGHQWSIADLFLWGCLKATPLFQTYTTHPIPTSPFPHLLRWYFTLDHLPFVQHAMAQTYPAAPHAPCTVAAPDASEPALVPAAGPMDLTLPDARVGQVVTRFPPEPSGYLHLGHVKAVLLNQYFANKYQGQLRFRLDDTNPTTETNEYADAIEADLAWLGVTYAAKSRTSDHFDVMLRYATQLVMQGDAYVDDTDVDTMRAQRTAGVASTCRTRSVAANLAAWEAMQQGTPMGLRSCLRAKISVDHPNKALRDPVVYRCHVQPHPHTGTRYTVYPTYDFACPVVDAVEGVTHALRTNEYRDRDPQYAWVQAKCQLPSVRVWDFSRLNFVYTLLSKRKLNHLVQTHRVSGWDDPRFPTVRGCRRRGLTVAALKAFILQQGASTKTMVLEWDKLWHMNKKVIDPIAPRHVVVQDPVEVRVLVPAATGGAAQEDAGGQHRLPYVKDVLRHKKHPAMGTKRTYFTDRILIDKCDVAGAVVGEEVTLMDWGNAVVCAVTTKAGSARCSSAGIMLRLHLAGDVKATKKKWTWVSADHAVGVTLKDYDYLITKKKLDPTDDFEAFINPVTEFTALGVADLNVLHLSVGAHVQFERKGFYVLDTKAVLPTQATLVFNKVPDGKLASVALKYQEGTKGGSRVEGGGAKTGEAGGGEHIDGTEEEGLSTVDLQPYFEMRYARDTLDLGLAQAQDGGVEETASAAAGASLAASRSRTKSKSKSRSRSRSRSGSRSRSKSQSST